MAGTPITKEITAPVELCGADGRLNPAAVGWSRHPLHIDNLHGRALRKKRWDYWCVMGEECAVSIVIANIDYLALGGVFIIDYATGKAAEAGIVWPFSKIVTLPSTVGGCIAMANKRLKLSMDETPEGVRIEVDGKSVGAAPLRAAFDIARPPEIETLNVVIPWDERTFQFTSKQNGLAVNGSCVWGDREYAFAPETAYAVLDYGRGIWPYRTAWNWAVFAGRSGEDRVGMNMGAKWTDGTGANENGIFLNGVLYKLFEDLEFRYDTKDFMAPWTMRSMETDAVDLRFTPFHDKKSRLNLGILSTRVDQCFGHYSGTLCVEGRTIPIDRFIGWAEEHYARW